MLRKIFARGLSGQATRRPIRSLQIESLDARVMLAGGSLLISEFLASGNTTLVDADNDMSDWIEIYNPTAETVNLAGWYLTDNAQTPDKWEFPSVDLAAENFLIVYASAKDRDRAGGELHTNFQLDSDGEFLALVRPDLSIAHAYDSDRVALRDGVSYGIIFSETDLVDSDSVTKLLVPSDNSVDASWMNPDFATDAAWQTLSLPLGAGEVSPGFTVRQATSDRPITSLDAARAIFASNDTSAETTLSGVPVIDLYGHGDKGRFSDDLTFPLGTTDDYALLATSTLFVTSESEYTFGVHSDEPVNLMIDDELVIKATTRFFEGDRISSGVTLTAGKHTIELLAIQSEGDSAIELFVGRGKIRAFHESMVLLGDPAMTNLQLITSPGNDLADISSLLGDAMSVYLRTPFSIDEHSQLETLTLPIRYNDGFIAYLNGVEVARRNAPVLADWSSEAPQPGPDSRLGSAEQIDLSSNIGLLHEGDNVLAIHLMRAGVDDTTLLIDPELTADGVFPQRLNFFPTPSPGEANEVGILGYVKDTKFSVDRGFFSELFELEIETNTPGATIVYTTDGSRPALDNGQAITSTSSGPSVATILISTTAAIRAAAFKENFEPTNVDTQTYIFLEDVIQQTQTPNGFPQVWDGAAQAPISADYEMDPDVVNDPKYRDEIIAGLRDIPTISLVMPPEDLFGSEKGIYIHSGLRGREWEHPTSVEFIEPDGSSFQIDSGIRIHGFSWRFHSNTPKHSFRLEFRNEYGPSKLEYPLFPDSPVDKFDSIVLRAQGGRSWGGTQNPVQSQYLRDTFARDTARDMGKVDGHAALVHLYLNGQYWGLYNPVERPDAQMAEEYFGGTQDDYDALNRRTTTNEAIDGDLVRYNEMIALANQMTAAANNGLDTTPMYQEILKYIDVDNAIDIMLIHQYMTNQDGPERFQSNNQRAIGSRVGDSQFKFFVWDMEYSMWNATDNDNISVDVPTSLSRVYSAMREHPDFRIRYADRVQMHMFNGGALTPEATEARWQTRAESIYRAIISESARWGDAVRTNNPYTRDVEWEAERNRLLNSYFPVRTEILLEQLRDASLYPTIDAAQFEVDGRSQFGGIVRDGQELTLQVPTGRGVATYYTTDGSDPRLPGGALSPTAIPYNGGPIVLTEATNVRVRIKQSQNWSAINEALFIVNVPASSDNLTVSEINYHPADPTAAELTAGFDDADQFEFIELLNKGTAPISLGGVSFTDGVTFNFSDSSEVTMLDVGQRLVLVRDAAAFEVRYGDAVTVAGEYSGGLSNGGERLIVTGLDGETIFDFQYDDNNGWPGRADGSGSSLELITGDGQLADDGAWRSSSEFGGSPGGEGSGPVRDVVINEVLSRTTAPAIDTVELHNTTGTDIDVSGWLLSDSSGDYSKFSISAGTLLAAGGYLLLDENDFNPTAGAVDTDFSLSGAHGDDVWLIETAADGRMVRFADHVDFGPMDDGETFGRSPNGTGRLVPNVSASLGAANSDPRIGPLVISEVMYNPSNIDSGDLEYIEIYNPTGATINMAGWRLDGGAELTFDEGTTLGAGKTLVAIRFNPDGEDNAQRLADFKTEYNLDDSVQLVGGYKGQLDNGGERIELLRPGTPPLDEPDFVPGLLEDEVGYDDESPWPAADGTGMSLTRLAVDVLGDLATNWEAAEPTPGSVSFDPPLAMPTVVSVSVSSSQWSETFSGVIGSPMEVAAGNEPLSWSDIDQIHVKLDGDPAAPLSVDDVAVYCVRSTQPGHFHLAEANWRGC